MTAKQNETPAITNITINQLYPSTQKRAKTSYGETGYVINYIINGVPHELPSELSTGALSDFSRLLTRAPIVITKDHTPKLTPKFTLNLLVISSIKTILSDIHIKADS